MGTHRLHGCLSSCCKRKYKKGSNLNVYHKATALVGFTAIASAVLQYFAVLNINRTQLRYGYKGHLSGRNHHLSRPEV